MSTHRNPLKLLKIPKHRILWTHVYVKLLFFLCTHLWMRKQSCHRFSDRVCRGLGPTIQGFTDLGALIGRRMRAWIILFSRLDAFVTPRGSGSCYHRGLACGVAWDRSEDGSALQEYTLQRLSHEFTPYAIARLILASLPKYFVAPQLYRAERFPIMRGLTLLIFDLGSL